MKRSCRIFLLSFALALVAVAAIYILLVSYCGRGYSGGQPWFLDFHPLKRHFAAQKLSPKIVLYGGSSSFYGINGEELRRYTGMDNINLSSSILMPMRFYLADLERYVGEGDVVVLPLEQNKHYCEGIEQVFSDFGISCLLGTLPETKRYLSAGELLSLYANYGFSWLTKALFHPDAVLGRLLLGDTKQGVFDGLHSEAYVADQWKRAAAGEIPKAGHPWEMSPYGDWLRDLPTKRLDIANPGISDLVTDEFLKSYRMIEQLVQSRHAKLLVVWTPQYFYFEQIGLKELVCKLEARGIRICGRPEALALPKSVYFDPLYHVNRDGARLWTRELAKTICAETGLPFLGGDEAWPYVVFADAPKEHFPGAGKSEVYETGVRIGAKSFPVAVRLPDDLRGQDLDVSIVLKPSVPGNLAISEIACGGSKLEFDENSFPVRSECRIFVPSNCTQAAALQLEISQSGESLGLERLFMCKAVGGAAKLAGTYSVVRDVELVRLGKGFANMEPWGCWTDGDMAQFELVVPSRFKGKDLQLTFDANTFVIEGHPVCAFSLASGDRHLADFESREFDHRFTVDVPASCAKGDVLPLTIRVKDPISHVELGKGADPRRLGVGLKRVRFAPGGGT